MVWTHNVGEIYCLTKTQEGNKVLATPYWKQTEDNSTIGDFKFQVKAKSVSTFYTRRELELEKVSENERRTLIHYHVEGWDDDKVPTKPDDITTLCELVKNCYSRLETNKADKAIVHCSAGIGRTGVFLALADVIGLIESLRNKNQTSEVPSSDQSGKDKLKEAVSIFDIVRSLREQRWGTVKSIVSLS